MRAAGLFPSRLLLAVAGVEPERAADPLMSSFFRYDRIVTPDGTRLKRR